MNNTMADAAVATAAAADAMDVDAAVERRFEVKKFNAVAHWRWTVCVDACAICRNDLYEPSIECQVQQPADDDHPGLSIVFGACEHVFHLDCIQRWLRQHSTCPLCAVEWVHARIEPIRR